MGFTIRAARANDREAVAGFTEGTFSWGDYVVEQFDRWLEAPASALLVAADDQDRAVGLGRMAMLSPSEAWLQGMRVAPGARRLGVASAISHELLDRAKTAGAVITRLAVEDGNDPAHALVSEVGFRPAGHWTRALREVSVGRPTPDGNGGRRVPPEDRLAPANVAEVMPAYMAWSSGPLARAGRRLFALRWTWRRLTEADLEKAARQDSFWAARSGWVMAAPDGDRLEVAWLEAGESESFDLLRAAYELGASQRLGMVAVTVPTVDWLQAGLERLGFEPYGFTIYATET